MLPRPWLFLFLALLPLEPALGIVRDGALDTTYVTQGSGYSSAQGKGLAPVFSTAANTDAVAVASAFLRKSDGSVLIVGTALNTVNANQRYGVGVVGLNNLGNAAYATQCTATFHDCDAAGSALGLNDSFSYDVVNAWLPYGDSGDIVAAGSLTNVAAALFVADIHDANASNNSSAIFLPADFGDTSYKSYVATAAVQTSADTIYIAGTAQFNGADTDFFVARLTNATGTWHPDTTFDQHGITFVNFDLGGTMADQAEAIAVGPDGKVTLVGTVSTGASNSVVGITRLDAFGFLDTTFGNNGRATLDFFGSAYAAKRSFGFAVALRDDGSMIVGGAAYRPAQGSFTAEQFAAVARLKSDGSIDSSTVFGAGSSATDNATTSNNGAAVLFHYFESLETSSYVDAIAIQPNGKILLAGAALNANFSYFGMSRLQKNGDPDASFSDLPDSGYKDSTETYSFQNGLNSYTIPFGSTQSNQDYATGIVSTPQGIYVYGTSTAPTTNNHDFGYIRLTDSDDIFANNFAQLPPGG